MGLEDKRLASVDDMTTAEMPPDPKKDSHWIESWGCKLHVKKKKNILLTTVYWLSVATDL
jgi:hypothetical protein